VLRGYARFYSLRRLLVDLATLRFAALRDHGWCWWFARRWRWDASNRRYLAGLAERTSTVEADELTAAASGL
ncbi:MAG: hypothetical protein ACXVP1_08620, partial [Thermoleophilia bacterium]